jgi:hypothetical protein
MQIDENNDAQILEEGTPSAMVCEDAGVQHLRGSQHQVRRRLLNSPPLGFRCITVVDRRGQTVFRREMVVPDSNRLELGKFAVLLGVNTQGMTVTSSAQGLVQRQQARHTAASAGGH